MSAPSPPTRCVVQGLVAHWHQVELALVAVAQPGPRGQRQHGPLAAHRRRKQLGRARAQEARARVAAGGAGSAGRRARQSCKCVCRQRAAQLTAECLQGRRRHWKPGQQRLLRCPSAGQQAGARLTAQAPRRTGAPSPQLPGDAVHLCAQQQAAHQANLRGWDTGTLVGPPPLPFLPDGCWHAAHAVRHAHACKHAVRAWPPSPLPTCRKSAPVPTPSSALSLPVEGESSSSTLSGVAPTACAAQPGRAGT